MALGDAYQSYYFMEIFFLSPLDTFPNSFIGRPRWMDSLMLYRKHVDILCAPRQFRIGESYFGYVSSKHQLRETDSFFIHTDEVNVLYLCALLNSSSYRSKIFGKRIRPYSIQQLNAVKLLGIPFSKADKGIQEELCVIESIILSLRYDKNIPKEHQRVLSYVISTFEQVRDAYIVEMENKWILTVWNIQIRKPWLKMLNGIYTGDLTEDIYVLFLELSKPTNILMNNIKRLKLYAQLNRI